MQGLGPIVSQVLIKMIASPAFTLVVLTRRVWFVTDTAGGGVVVFERSITRWALGVGWLSGGAALLVHEVLERVSGRRDITTT